MTIHFLTQFYCTHLQPMADKPHRLSDVIGLSTLQSGKYFHPLDYLKIFKCLRYRFYLFFRRTFPRLLQFLCRIRSIIHCQPQRPFHFRNICSMYLKSILLLHIFPYHFICNFRFRLIFLRPFCNRIQRYLIIAFSKFYLYINNTVRGFVG